MQDQLERAVLDAAEFGAPAKTFQVGPDAAMDFGNGANPFEHMTVTHWSVD